MDLKEEGLLLLSVVKSGCHLPSSYLEKPLVAYFSQGRRESKKGKLAVSFGLLSSVGRITKDIFVNGRPEAKEGITWFFSRRTKVILKHYLFCVRLER